MADRTNRHERGEVSAFGGIDGGWLWLFPLTYTIHMTEEGFGGERFYFWIRHMIGRVLSPEQFWLINGLLLLGMVTTIAVVRRKSELAWLVATLGAVVIVNGLGHVAGTMAVRLYSPGLFSGVLLWIPLGAVALVQSSRAIPRRCWWGSVLLGIAIMAGISLLAFVVSH